MKLTITKAELLNQFQRHTPDITEVEVEGLTSVGSPSTPNSFNPNVLPIQIGKYLQQGNLIGAVKEARAMYGLGLKEAKDYCELYYSSTSHS